MKWNYPRVVSNETTKLSPWVTLSAKHVVRRGDGEIAVFHSLQQSDYVTVFVVRTDGLIPIVKQFRPAVEQITFELPSGLLDREADPESVAISEVYEETGHKVIGKFQLMGRLYPDTGRLENRFWAFFAEVSSDVDDDWIPEAGIELVLVSRRELREMIFDGQFNHALHLALIGLALTKGLFSW
jgi:ADP-ribose pyrophosphatase